MTVPLVIITLVVIVAVLTKFGFLEVKSGTTINSAVGPMSCVCDTPVCQQMNPDGTVRFCFSSYKELAELRGEPAFSKVLQLTFYGNVMMADGSNAHCYCVVE